MRAPRNQFVVISSSFPSCFVSSLIYLYPDRDSETRDKKADGLSRANRGRRSGKLPVIFHLLKTIAACIAAPGTFKVIQIKTAAT